MRLAKMSRASFPTSVTKLPVTYARLGSGVVPGTALTFLPLQMCLPTVVMSRGVPPPRSTYVYVVAWTGFAILAGVALEALGGWGVR